MAELTGLRIERRLRDTKPGDSSGVRNRGVLILMALVFTTLIPGLVVRFGLGESVPGAAGQWLAILDAELQTIEFGKGLRFWLGVTGAGMMALLLLYPLRKLMGLSRLVGITAWFNIHVVLGLLGPAMILYHTNFGLGSRPANVALFTTLIVAASGLVGYFLYTRYSAIFYRLRSHGRASLDDAISTLGALQPGPTKDRLIEDLRQFDQRMLEERRGLIASTRSRQTIRTFERDALTRAAYLIDAHGATVPATLRLELRRRIGGHLRRYFALVRRSERWSIYERLWAKWRLLHLPVFAITVIAATIHVVKVWGIDTPAAISAAEPAVRTTDDAGSSRSADGMGGTSSPTPAVRAASPLAVRPIRTTSVPADPVNAANPPPVLVSEPKRAMRASSATAMTAGNAGSSSSANQATVNASSDPPPKDSSAMQGENAGVPTAAAASALPPVVALTPRATMPKPAPQQEPHPAERAVPAAPATMPLAPIARTAPSQPPAAVTAQLRAPATTPEPPAAAKKPPAPDSSAAGAIAELARRNKLDNRGRFDLATMAARLSQLKQENFDHSKTDFPLTGKHAKIQCESCHKATLKDTKKDCLACHKKDDVHKGRRPDCAQCHTTTNWSTIIRKK